MKKEKNNKEIDKDKRKKEINNFIKKFKKLWIKYPYFRFGQLCNAVFYFTEADDLFYVSDNDMLKRINTLNEVLEKGV